MRHINNLGLQSFLGNFDIVGEIEKSLPKQINRPYILLLVGGESQKAQPLKIILERWKDINMLDGMVTSENIA